MSPLLTVNSTSLTYTRRQSLSGSRSVNCTHTTTSKETSLPQPYPSKVWMSKKQTNHIVECTRIVKRKARLLRKLLRYSLTPSTQWRSLGMRGGSRDAMIHSPPDMSVVRTRENIFQFSGKYQRTTNNLFTDETLIFLPCPDLSLQQVTTNSSESYIATPAYPWHYQRSQHLDVEG